MSRRAPLPPQICQRLNSRTGRSFWQSLEELTDSEEFRSYLAQEFPSGAAEWKDGLDRRRFFSLMAAGLGLAGMTGCFYQPTETIVPYVRAPEQLIPGKPLFYATTYCERGGALGLLVESHMGRPTKVEGNPLHPASLGATDLFAQASVLQLYDPDRSQTIDHLAEIGTWDGFLTEVRARLEGQQATRGGGVRILTESVLSPTLARQIGQLLAAYPEARWVRYEPLGDDAPSAGASLAFDRPVNTVYRFDLAEVVLALDADFLSAGPRSVREARDFMSRREVRQDRREMNRLYAVEGTPSPTGAAADHRLPLSTLAIPGFLRRLASRLLGGASSAALPESTEGRWIEALAADLLAHRERSVIVAGRGQPAETQALALALNQQLGNLGQTLIVTDPVQAEPPTPRLGLAELANELRAGKVDLLVILGGNPVYTAPAELGFAEALRSAAERRVAGRPQMTAVHLSLYRDETSELCHWHLPAAHYLESWSDARTFDGTASIVQPLIAPLYDGRTAHAILAAMTQTTSTTDYELVRQTWRELRPGDFDRRWERWLHDGLIEGTAFAPLDVRPRSAQELLADASQQASAPAGLSLQFTPDPSVWDGRFANNAWLQELPKPFSKLTWDNAALIAPATAENLGLRSGDLVTLRTGERSLEAAVWVHPGQAADAVSLSLGYGRRRAGRVGTGLGFDAYSLRTSEAPWVATGLQVVPTGRRYELAVTQTHHSLEGRDIVRWGDLEEYRRDPHAVAAGHAHHGPLETLYPESTWTYEGHAWGMSIDLSRCTGCNACVVACQAENNVPTVGKEGVARSREMHWLRIDNYYEGEPDDPLFLQQPMLCQHCEKAPCEMVCPVAATTHSAKGLNEMTYNRCIGTRYCSNNCPYKVRRFNFFQYVDETTPVLKLLRNPDVTVRSRGVMEKCTFCVQRINSARIDAKLRAANDGGDERVRDGEVVTACQAACPTQAIVFGDLNDPESRVRKLHDEPSAYGVLAELGVRPRIAYLARVYNPNPALAPVDEDGEPRRHGGGRA